MARLSSPSSPTWVSPASLPTLDVVRSRERPAEFRLPTPPSFTGTTGQFYATFRTMFMLLTSDLLYSSSASQYWAYVSGSSFTSPLMKPGTYTMVLYKGELAVGSQTVSVSAGGTTTSNIASSNDPTSTTPTWIIGESV